MNVSDNSKRRIAIQGFLERVVELVFEDDPPDYDSAVHLMRKVEEFRKMTDREFEEKYLQD